MPKAELTLQDLPKEVFREILYFSSPKDILEMCQGDSVSRVCFDERFWRFKTLYDFPETEEEYNELKSDLALSWKQFYRAKARQRKIIPVYEQGRAVTFVSVSKQTRVQSALSRIRQLLSLQSRKEVQLVTGEKTLRLGTLGVNSGQDILWVKVPGSTFAQKPFEDPEYFLLS